MKNKLFLYSMNTDEKQLHALDRLTGKTDRSEIRIAAIVHATDVFPDADDWVPGVLDSLRAHGYNVRIKDLNHSMDFDDCDIIWICGGHTYYLRYILKKPAPMMRLSGPSPREKSSQDGVRVPSLPALQPSFST